MNTTHRFFPHSSPFIIAAFVVAAALAGVEPVQASPDPPVYITNGVALFQGNQSNGIASGVDFQPAQVTTLNVNSLSGAIQPANGVSGINFQNSGAGNVTINAGWPAATSSSTQPARPELSPGASEVRRPIRPPTRFGASRSRPIPAVSGRGGAGAKPQRHHHRRRQRGRDRRHEPDDRLFAGDNPAIGKFHRVRHHLHGDWGDKRRRDRSHNWRSVTGTLVDTNGNPIAGNGGTFVINTNGTFSFDAGTNFNGLAIGETVQTIVNYTVQGVNGTGMTNDSSGTLVTTITMTTNGLVINSGAYSAQYGPSTQSRIPCCRTWPATAKPWRGLHPRAVPATASPLTTKEPS